VTESSVDATGLLDHIHAAYWVGYDAGYAAGSRAASEDLAREWLAELGADMEYRALCAAAAKGPRWKRAIREQTAS
jgi:hypothetical protein